MSLFRREASISTDVGWVDPAEAVRRNRVNPAMPVVNDEAALHNSAVWAALRLRANLMSSFPVDAYRKSPDGTPLEVAKPQVLINPGGPGVTMREWLYSTQFDLDRGGNVFGLITARYGTGLPARIELVPLSSVAVIIKDGLLTGYRINGIEYPPSQVWHEKQYTVPGLHVGLSPIAYAAWSLGEYQSIQQFAMDWFMNKTIPAGHLRNTNKTLDKTQARTIKDQFQTSVGNGEVFVTGQDWEYSMIAAEGAAAGWLDAKQLGLGDIARFFDIPSDLIDVPVQGTASLNYANITQRNLQLLIINLGPAAARREDALTTLLPAPRYVKLNTNALLRMDPETRARTVAVQINSRVLAPDEARDIDDRPPFTSEQIAQFEAVGLNGQKAPSVAPNQSGN